MRGIENIGIDEDKLGCHVRTLQLIEVRRNWFHLHHF